MNVGSCLKHKKIQNTSLKMRLIALEQKYRNNKTVKTNLCGFINGKRFSAELNTRKFYLLFEDASTFKHKYLLQRRCWLDWGWRGWKICELWNIPHPFPAEKYIKYIGCVKKCAVLCYKFTMPRMINLLDIIRLFMWLYCADKMINAKRIRLFTVNLSKIKFAVQH